MSFLDLAKQRFSVRSYTAQKVEQEKLERILEAGWVAPTGANAQPYRLIAVQESEGLEKINKAANIYNAPLAIIVCGNAAEAWVRPFDNKNIVDIDTAIVTDHMMLEAAELGLGSVWVCYFKPDIIRQEFNLPKVLDPMSILAIGYSNEMPASPERHKKLRKSMKELIFFERLT